MALLTLVSDNDVNMAWLTYLSDDFIYWTDIETLSVNMVRSDGTKRTTLVTTHDLRAPTMPIIAISRHDSIDDSETDAQIFITMSIFYLF